MKEEINSMSYTVGSLFAGIGGICQGFSDAGFKVLWANEYDKNACVTYRENFSHQLIEGDICQLNPKDFQKVDIITSGFPCQAFSIAGYRRGFDDERGNLFFETMRFVDELQPKAFLFENVKNLASHDGGLTLRIMKEKIEGSGYSCFTQVLNTAKATNIPQNRERIFFVGFKKGMNSECSIPCFNFPKEERETLSIRKLLDKGKVPDRYYYNDSRYQEKFSEITWKMDTLYQWRRVYLRENKSNLCPTLTANMGTGGHNVPLVKDDFGVRKLTPRECARFQGYPDSFILPDFVANTQLYKQVGNSVTVPLIKKIALSIKEAFQKPTEKIRENFVYEMQQELAFV